MEFKRDRLVFDAISAKCSRSSPSVEMTLPDFSLERERPSFFIPGINGKARCCESSTILFKDTSNRRSNRTSHANEIDSLENDGRELRKTKKSKKSSAKSSRNKRGKGIDMDRLLFNERSTRLRLHKAEHSLSRRSIDDTNVIDTAQIVRRESFLQPRSSLGSSIPDLDVQDIGSQSDEVLGTLRQRRLSMDGLPALCSPYSTTMDDDDTNSLTQNLHNSILASLGCPRTPISVRDVMSFNEGHLSAESLVSAQKIESPSITSVESTFESRDSVLSESDPSPYSVKSQFYKTVPTAGSLRKAIFHASSSSSGHKSMGSLLYNTSDQVRSKSSFDLDNMDDLDDLDDICDIGPMERLYTRLTMLGMDDWDNDDFFGKVTLRTAPVLSVSNKPVLPYEHEEVPRDKPLPSIPLLVKKDKKSKRPSSRRRGQVGAEEEAHTSSSHKRSERSDKVKSDRTNSQKINSDNEKAGRIRSVKDRSNKSRVDGHHSIRQHSETTSSTTKCSESPNSPRSPRTTLSSVPSRITSRKSSRRCSSMIDTSSSDKTNNNNNHNNNTVV